MITPEDIRIPLDPEQMTDIYDQIMRDTGKASVAKVAQWLADHGILSYRTRRPFTRQNVHLAMLKSARGRKLLAKLPK